MALILCAAISRLCPPHPCGCTVLRGSEAPPLRHPQSLPTKGIPSAWQLFLLHSSLPLVQVPSLFFCLGVFFFLFPYPGTWGVSCLLGSLWSSASIQYCSTCRCISDVFVGRKVISTSYSSAILKLLHTFFFVISFLSPLCTFSFLFLFSFHFHAVCIASPKST